MSTSAADPLDDDDILLLKQLARGVLPIQDWIGNKLARYRPEDNPSWLEPTLGFQHPLSVPWRSNVLSTDDLGVVEHLVETLRAPDNTSARHHRWRMLLANPLRDCPIPAPAQWRSDRGMRTNPQFGIFESGNEFMAQNNQFLDRVTFYRDFLSELRRVFADVKWDDPAEARKAADALWQDRHPNWPPQIPKSSDYIRQFARDLLIAVMGMRNRSPHEDSPLWKYAVLIELGEHRRAGNAYTPEQVEQTVKLFHDRLQEMLKP